MRTLETVIRKLYWNYEKEEEWLNSMAADGLALKAYSWGKYMFEDCKPGEYIFRTELLEQRASLPKSREYIAFMEETGAQHVSSYFRWVIFRRKADEGSFDIYSDIDSKINHYKRAFRLFGFIALLNIYPAVMNLSIGFFMHSSASPFSSFLGLINLSFACCLGYLSVTYLHKIKKLKNDKMLKE